jgi:hypothetical protein
MQGRAKRTGRSVSASIHSCSCLFHEHNRTSWSVSLEIPYSYLPFVSPICSNSNSLPDDPP